MSARRRTARAAAPPRSRLPIPAILGVVVVAVGAAAWLMLRAGSAGESASGPGGLPGPIGGSTQQVIVLAVAWAYLAAMSCEFGCRAWLKRHPLIYLVSHMGIT